MKTYIQQVKDKTVEINENSFDDFVEFWHTSDQTRNITLHEAIGVTWEEYSKNIIEQEKMLKLLKSKANS